MADPHIQSPMDFWDYLTVIIYRSGFVLATLMLLLLPYYPQTAQYGLLVSGTMLASSLSLCQIVSPDFPIFCLDWLTWCCV